MPLNPKTRQNAGGMAAPAESGIFSISAYLLGAGVFATIVAVSAPVLAQSSSSEKDAVQQYTTPAGHKYWHYPMPGAARTAVAVSWAQEVPLHDNTHPATARLAINVMLNGGAGGRDAAEIVADYQDLDAGSGLWVQPRDVSGFIVAPDEHLASAREIAHEVLTEPAFGQRWFDREHQSMVEAAVDNQTNSWGRGWNLARELVLGKHPYKKFWSEYPVDDIKAISLDDVRQWHKTSLSTATATISVAGSAAKHEVAKEIDLLLADLPSSEAPDSIDFPEPVVPGKTIVLHSPDAPKTVVILLGSFPAHDQGTDIPLQLGVGVLGLGQQSRLFKTVRSGLGATYGFGASVFNFTREHRILQMSGEIETAKLQEALNEIEKAYSEFREDGVGRLEFPVAKRFYSRETKKQLQNPIAVAFSVSDAVRNGFGNDYMHNLLDNIDDLARGSTNETIKASFPAYDKLLKVIVSPDKQVLKDACVISTIEDSSDCL